MKVIFTSKELYNVVSEDSKPKREGDPTLNDWKKKNAKAQEIIITIRMEEGPMSHVISCTTANEMWEKLLSIYEQKSEVSIHLLQQRFFNYIYENEGVAVHVSRLEELANKLKQGGENISNNILITKVVTSLPEQFKHFISA